MSIFNSNELISVIVPVYRAEKYLRKCVDSIRNQTYTDIEIILIDDGSDDESSSICDEYAAKDNRVKVIHKENGGQDSARKAGLRISKGSYIGYVDSDDWIDPHMYEKLLKHAITEKVEVVESGIIDVVGEKETVRKPYLHEGLYKDERYKKEIEKVLMYTGDFFNATITPYLCSKLFKRSAIERYQFCNDPIQNFLDDDLVVYPVIAETKSLYVCSRSYYYYRLNNSSTKHSVNKKSNQYASQIYDSFYERMIANCHHDSLIQQLKYYTMYNLLCRFLQVFDARNSDKCLVPFGGIEKSAKIIIYGAGSVGIMAYDYIKSIANGPEIVLWVDKSYREIGDTYKVASPELIIHNKFDYIVIAVMRQTAVESIKKDLNKIGIANQKIRWISKQYLDNPDDLLKQVDYSRLDD